MPPRCAETSALPKIKPIKREREAKSIKNEEEERV
jgi:hypothetical protein